MKNPRIFIVQMEIVPNNLAANLEKIKAYFEKAKGCDFIIFPEFLDGNLDFTSVDEESNIKFKKTFSELCRKYKIYAIAGSICEKANDKIYDRCHVYDRNGVCLGFQDKKALTWHQEIGRLTSSNESKVFDTEFGKIGIQLCRDFLYPEITNELRKKGAKIVFSPAFWNQYSKDFVMNKIKSKVPLDSEIRVINSIVPARAIENEVIFVYCNCGGLYKTNEKYELAAGYSQVVMPFFGAKSVISHSTEDTLIVEVDLQIVEDARNSYKIEETRPDQR